MEWHAGPCWGGHYGAEDVKWALAETRHRARLRTGEQDGSKLIIRSTCPNSRPRSDRMIGGTRNLLRLAPQRAAQALRTKAVAIRGGPGGPDPNAVKARPSVLSCKALGYREDRALSLPLLASCQSVAIACDAISTAWLRPVQRICSLRTKGSSPLAWKICLFESSQPEGPGLAPGGQNGPPSSPESGSAQKAHATTIQRGGRTLTWSPCCAAQVGAGCPPCALARRARGVRGVRHVGKSPARTPGRCVRRACVIHLDDRDLQLGGSRLSAPVARGVQPLC
jgi:hypothetical protein